MYKQKQQKPILSVSRPVVAAICLLLIGVTLAAQVFTRPEHTQAATNDTINFQARLLTNTGSVVSDGYYNVEFKLYNVVSGGTVLWTETRTSANRVRVVNGYLTANLGSVTSFPGTIDWDQELWMTMNIGGITESPDWDGEMSPRLKLTAVPYAKHAGELAGGSGANRTVLDTGTPSGSNVLHLPAESGTLCVQNSSLCGFLSTSSGVQLQATTPGSQQTGNFNISGTGIAGTKILTPAVDSSSALSLGTGSATSVSLGRTGITTTVTGSSILLTGDTTVTSGSSLSVQSGWASIIGLSTANPNPTLTINSHSSGANPLVVQSGGTTVFTVANGGAATFRNASDVVNAFSIQNAGGSTLFNADSLNGRVGIGGTATYSKFEVIGGDAAVYNNGGNPRLVLGDSTSTGENGYLQWDSTNNYFRIESVGTNGLKINDNYVAIGNIYPSQPLIVGNGSTLLFQINTTGEVLAKTSTNSATALQVQNASGTSLFTVDTLSPQLGLNTTTVVQGAAAGSATALTVNTGAASNKGLVVKAAASQTGDLVVIQDASNNQLFKVDADGDTTIARTLDIQYQSGVTNQLTIQGPSSTFVTVNANQNKFFIGGDDVQCTGRFCVYQSTTGTGGASYTNTYNASLLNVSTASFAINQDIILTDTSSAGVGNTLRGIRINSTGTTNTDATIHSIQIQLPTTTSNSVYAGNAIQVQNGSTNIFRITNVGQTTFQTTSGFSSAFAVQNTSGNAILSVDTTGGGNQVLLGKASTLNGKLAFQNSTNANTVTIQTGTTSSSYSLTLPTALGVSGNCLKDTNGSGALGFGTCAGDLQTAYNASTSPEIVLNSTNGALTIRDASSSVGTLFEVGDNAGTTTYFNVTTGGAYLNGGSFNTTDAGTVIASTFRTADQSVLGTASAAALFVSGQTTGASANSGAVTVRSGHALTSGNTGSVVLQTGNATSGNSGGITIDVGTATGTRGAISIGTANASSITMGSTSIVGNFNIQNQGTLSKQYRFRTSGTALDIESAGADMYMSGWTGADYTGTQYTWMRGNLSLPALFVGSGNPSGSPMRLILADKNTAGDPTGYNGALYYNSNAGKFRCYENGNWKNCLGFDANIVIFGANGNGAASQWTNMPAALTELFGADVPSPASRVLFDLSNATQIRFQVNVATAGSTNAQLRIQYSTDQSTWNYLDSANTGLGQSVNSTGLKTSAWSTIASGARDDVYLRVVGISGDAAADPRFGLIQVQAR